MHQLVLEYSERIAELCRRHGVRRLDVFGSAARGADFDPAESDFDFLVEFESDANQGPTIGDYFAFRDELAAILGRPVDLVMAGGIRNPYVEAEIERSREQVYAA